MSKSEFQHHTKTKGDIGVMKVKLDLILKGYLILQPETEHSPFDIVAYKDGMFKRIQIKYREINNKGSISIKFGTSWADKNGNHFKEYDKKDIDYICIYCPNTDKCYYIKSNEIKKSFVLRLNYKYSKQNRQHDAENYTNL